MSTPRSILLHIDATARMPERIRVARALAETFDADVACRLCSMADALRDSSSYGAVAQRIDLLREAERAERQRHHALFSAHSAGAPRLRWVEPGSATPWEFARHALYADLLLLGQRDRSDPHDHLLPGDFLANVLLQCGRPALVLPYTGEVAAIGRTVLVAWNESREAARAVGAAMPWLRTAASVHVVAYGEETDPPLAHLRQHLQAHGIANPTLHTGGPADDVGARLLSLGADVGADLLVMGCYGSHSRLREWVLGGATRSILDTMTVPVLLSH